MLLTRNVRDFLTIQERDPDHHGILLEYQDKDSSKNMAASDLVRSIGNLEASGWNIRGHFVALNAWLF